MSKNNKLGATIKRLMREKRITGEKMGEKIDAHPITVSKLLNGRMSLTESWLQKLADALDMTVAEIATEAGASDLPRRRPEHFPSLPVYGLAAASVAGNLTMTTDPVEWVSAPAPLSTVREAYALRVIGSSMEPRYFPGDVIFIHPHKPPMSGDHVVIQEAMNGGMAVSVKRYDKTTEQHIVTTQYNPLAEIKFSRSRVIAMHRVLTQNEINGI
ncbi:XRE family transcriptional regulator [Hoeflea sp.]|uniref:XRE family transcriptional regulator n=1 Tax=Hoeflea sp. TaxID=1940281 RepID=UPI003B527C14